MYNICYYLKKGELRYRNYVRRLECSYMLQWAAIASHVLQDVFLGYVYIVFFSRFRAIIKNFNLVLYQLILAYKFSGSFFTKCLTF